MAQQSWQIIVSHTFNRLGIVIPVRYDFSEAMEKFMTQCKGKGKRGFV